jgi:hypothetical protein
MDPLNTSDAPGTAVIRWAMRPPVQLSAAAILHPLFRSASMSSCAMFFSSITVPPAIVIFMMKFYHRGVVLSRDFPCAGVPYGV